MKNILIIISICIIFYACKKESSSAKINTNQSIVGTWYYSADTVKEYKNGVLQFTNNTGGITFGQSSYLQFNQDGTGIQNFGANATHFTYLISNNIITFNVQAQMVNGLPITAYTGTGTIKNQTSNQFEIYYDDKSSDGGDVIEDTEAAYFTK